MSILKDTLPKNARLLALEISKLVSRHKAEQIRLFEVTKNCDYADFFVVCSGGSHRHVQAIAQTILDAAGSDAQVEGMENGEWVLLDLGDVIVHVFHHDIRSHYNFDKLWAHVPSAILEDENSKLKTVAMSAV